jgi:hypothetical protein
VLADAPFNPLDKRHLGQSVAEALLLQSPIRLPLKDEFDGAGTYVIYYTGSFKPYAPISKANQDNKWSQPIYVGKAVPPGARRGGFGLELPPGNALFRRLGEHEVSIQQAKNLDVADFYCRYLLVDDIWIPLSETVLIQRYAPLWNTLVVGFGNHDPGSGRHKQKMSPWDIIHPGRPWADRLEPGDKTSADIIKEIRQSLRSMSNDVGQ